MATSFHLFNPVHVTGRLPHQPKKPKTSISQQGSKYPTGRYRSWCHQVSHSATCFLSVAASLNFEPASSNALITSNPSHALRAIENAKLNLLGHSDGAFDFTKSFLLADLDPATAKLAIGILGPFLSAFAFLFILRIIMSWYPKLPVGKFPYIIAYAPTEPLLVATRKLIPPLGGVDITPVVWFGLVSFVNEILLGPQGLLVLVSQQVS